MGSGSGGDSGSSGGSSGGGSEGGGDLSSGSGDGSGEGSSEGPDIEISESALDTDGDGIADTDDPDDDDDGMPDAWEIDNGFDPLDPSDADLDADGDGWSNLEEYLAGTDPRSTLLGSWSFDEEGGTLVADASSNENHGQLEGTPTRVLLAEGSALEVLPARCRIEMDEAPTFDMEKLSWTLHNDSGATLQIEGLSVFWLEADEALQKVKLGGHEIYKASAKTAATDPYQSPTSVTIDSGWNSSVKKRQIDAGESKDLVLEFALELAGDADDYGVEIDFASRCGAGFGYDVAHEVDTDRVIVPDHRSLDAESAITIAAWLMPNAVAEQSVIHKAWGGAADGFELGLTDRGEVFVRFNEASAGDAYTLYSMTHYPNPNLAEWIHVAAVFDGAEIRLYIDGELDAVAPARGLAIGMNDAPLSMGASCDGTAPYSGLLDEVSLHGGALSAGEIRGMAGVPSDRIAEHHEPMRGALEGAFDDLAVLLPTGDDQADDKIEKALTKLEKALANEYWTDGSHLVPDSDGEKVFKEIKSAVEELMHVDTPMGDVINAIDVLVSAARDLARISIDEAVARAGDPKKIGEAETEMEKAEAEIDDKGHHLHAVDHFGKAWKAAAVNAV